MRFLMLIVDESKKEQLEALLNRVGVEGYTEIPQVVGLGTTGPRLGSRAFPKTSAIIFSLVRADLEARLLEAIREFCRECGEKLKIIAWNAEELAL